MERILDGSLLWHVVVPFLRHKWPGIDRNCIDITQRFEKRIALLDEDFAAIGTQLSAVPWTIWNALRMATATSVLIFASWSASSCLDVVHHSS